MSLQVNDIIDGKYRIVRLLGEGGMGAVYEGENTRIHRRVAIKVLHSAVAQSKDAAERFEREAQAAGRIGSEHIVEVLDLGNLANGERYMVMEFLEGQTLSDRIATRGRLDARQTADLAVQLLDGLKAAHDAGIVHRDLKPDNVFLLSSRRSRKDFVKIVDFGISKFSAMSGDFSMTRTGAVMGTPYYMAPEQAKGERTVDQRADLYAVGVILYEAVTGKVPFDADTFNELLFKIVLEDPVAIRERAPDLDDRFADIVRKAMTKSPSERYASASDFQADLMSYLDVVPFDKDGTAHAGTPARALDATQVASAALVKDVRLQNAEPDHAEPKKGQGQTLGTWANTQDGAFTAAEAPRKSGLNKTVMGAGVGVLALVAAAAFALRGGGETSELQGAPPSPATASTTMSEAAPSPSAPVKAEEIKPPAVPEEKAASPAAPAAPVEPVQQPDFATASATTAPTKNVSSAKAPAKTVTTPAKSGGPAAPAHKTPGRAATGEKAGSNSSGSAGRRIRTTL